MPASPHDQDVITALAGKTIRQAFLDFVIHDPEVQRLGYVAMECDPSLGCIFCDGLNYPVPYWPLKEGTSVGCYRREGSAIGLGGPPPSSVIQAAGETVQQRYEAFLSPLRHGDLKVIGYDRDRNRAEILSSLWSGRYYLDIEENRLLTLSGKRLEKHSPTDPMIFKSLYTDLKIEPLARSVVVGSMIPTPSEECRKPNKMNAVLQILKDMRAEGHEVVELNKVVKKDIMRRFRGKYPSLGECSEGTMKSAFASFKRPPDAALD